MKKSMGWAVVVMALLSGWAQAQLANDVIITTPLATKVISWPYKGCVMASPQGGSIIMVLVTQKVERVRISFFNADGGEIEKRGLSHAGEILFPKGAEVGEVVLKEGMRGVFIEVPVHGHYITGEPAPVLVKVCREE